MVKEDSITAVNESTARTATGEFISNLPERPTPVTESTAITVTGEFISNREGRLTAVKELTARTATGGFISCPHCVAGVDGENSSQIVKGNSL